jgi:hypothetical protein
MKNRILAVTSDVLGGLGVTACVVAGVARLAGVFYLLDAETLTVFQAGTGIMVAACLLKLWNLERGAND